MSKYPSYLPAVNYDCKNCNVRWYDGSGKDQSICWNCLKMVSRLTSVETTGCQQRNFPEEG